VGVSETVRQRRKEPHKILKLFELKQRIEAKLKPLFAWASVSLL